MKTFVRFELGDIDPYKQCFDHHGAFPKEFAFLGKMASVQLMEWCFISKKNRQEIELVMNHAGHMDDIIAHAALKANEKQFVSLYGFACQVSVIDSCGPSFKGLLSKQINDTMNSTYERYQRVITDYCTNMNLEKFQVPLDYQIYASKIAAEYLLFLLPDISEPEVEIKTPEPAYYEKTDFNFKGLTLVEIRSDNFNPFQMAPFFYQFNKYVFMYKRRNLKYQYTLLCRSPYDGNLTPLYEALNEIEAGWGGHAGAGGSPRQEHSKIKPMDLYNIFSKVIKS